MWTIIPIIAIVKLQRHMNKVVYLAIFLTIVFLITRAGLSLFHYINGQTSTVIHNPTKFYVTDNNFYIFDEGIKRFDGATGFPSTNYIPPIVWVYDLPSGSFNKKLQLETDTAKQIDKQLTPATIYSTSFKSCLQKDELYKKPDGQVEYYMLYPKNNEILIYPKNIAGTYMTDGSKVPGFVSEINLSDTPVGMISFNNNIYLVSKTLPNEDISVTKIDQTSKELQNITSIEKITHPFFYCDKDNGILQIMSDTQLTYYDLKSEKNIFNVQLETKYGTNFIDLGEYVFVYSKDKLLLISKNENKISKQFEGDFGQMFDYNDIYLIFFDKDQSKGNNVFLFNKKTQELKKFAGGK